MISHMVSLVNDLATGGGLKSHDIKNLSQAAKVLSEADQREQQLLKEEQARARNTSQGGQSNGFYVESIMGTRLPLATQQDRDFVEAIQLLEKGYDIGSLQQLPYYREQERQRLERESLAEPEYEGEGLA